MLFLLDKSFFVGHTLFILFNILGWIPKRTRRLNLFTLSLTAASWFILGIWYGFGYCFCTDWHWDVRRNLGYEESSGSYIKFLLDSLTGYDFDPDLVMNMTGAVFFLVFGISLFLNIRDYRMAKRAHRSNEGGL